MTTYQEETDGERIAEVYDVLFGSTAHVSVYELAK